MMKTTLESNWDHGMGEIIKVPESEILVVAGDLNGHIGKYIDGFENIHRGKKGLW